MFDVSSKVAALVAKLPEPDERGFMSVIDKKVVDEVTAGIAAGGADSLTALIGMLAEPGSGENYKAHYALHCLALAAYQAGGADRSKFAETLAGQLDGDLAKGVKVYLIQELQSVGGREAMEALGKQLGDEDLCDPAARALVSIGRGAGRQLATALSKVTGKCRLTIVQALASIGSSRSVGLLTEALGDKDADVRLIALSGLAGIGDEGSIDAVVKAADVKAGWERIKATQACLVLAEKLAADGKKDKAGRVYKHLAMTRAGKDEAYIREAAEAALAAL